MRIAISTVASTIFITALIEACAAEEEGLILECQGKATATTSGNEQPVFGDAFIRLEIDVKGRNTCLEFRTVDLSGGEKKKSGCYETVVTDDRFVLKTARFTNLGAGKTIESGDTVISRYLGSLHHYNIQTHFGGNYAVRYDFKYKCHKSGTFSSAKKF